MLMHQSRLAPARVIGVVLAIAAASLFADVASARERRAVSTVVKYARSRSYAVGGHLTSVRAAEVRFAEGLRQLRLHARCGCRRLHEACYEEALNNGSRESE